MTAMPLTYREEIIQKIFSCIKSGESFYLIGAPSSGKTRLLDFLMGDDPDARRSGAKVDSHLRLKKQYLKTEAENTWLVRVDMNRVHKDLAVGWKFQFYELLLNSILLTLQGVSETDHSESIFKEASDLDPRVLESGDTLTAHRLLEIFINRLRWKYNIKLCFLFDEFDDTYREMPLDVFSQLRAIRDANKYFVCYGLSLRALPESLRQPGQNEGFFELISSRMIGVGLYSKRDTLSIIEQWEERHEKSLPPRQREWLWEQSGGHPGLARALFGLLTESPQAASKLDNLEWFARQETVREEMRKIWEGLSKEEQAALQQIKRQNAKSIPLPIGKQLHAKGLIKFEKSNLTFFSPLFSYRVK